MWNPPWRYSGLHGAADALWAYRPPNEDLEDLEALWRGGVADFGDPRAAQAIQQAPGYGDYISAVRRLVERDLGKTFTLYRAMPRAQLDDWRRVKPRLSYFSFTYDQSVADAWRRLAGHRNADLVVVAGQFTPEAVVMRGKADEAELVVSGAKTKPDQLVIV